METVFYISLHIKTPPGFETYGTFDLGDDREKANEVFSQLKGDYNVTEKSILHMDFTEVQDGIPLPIKILYCTLDDVALNTKIITRAVFKNKGLKQIKL